MNADERMHKSITEMSVYDFKWQIKHTLTDEIKKISITKYEDIPDINDTEKYNWVQVGTE